MGRCDDSDARTTQWMIGRFGSILIRSRRHWAAHDFYATASAAAGAGFQAELENAKLAIAKNPDMWASYLFGTQRYIMRGFHMLSSTG
jgi:hypothetical protein